MLEGWYAALERVRLPKVTFNDGRHSYNSALMHVGVDWRVSADQTGHTTAALQKHYSHGTPESRRQAAATLQAGLDAARVRVRDPINPLSDCTPSVPVAAALVTLQALVCGPFS